MRLDFSVIIPTYNQSKNLNNAIKSLKELNYNPQKFEIIVVDNYCKDDSEEIVRKHSIKNEFLIRYIREEKIGLNNARNAGIRVARGDIIAFIDDDVTVDKDWLNQLFETYKATKAWCVGGKVRLVYSGNMPDWIPPRRLYFLSEVDYGNKALILTSKKFPVGCNISFKRDVFENIGYFLDGLDRKGRVLLGGGENEICTRIQKKGWIIYYNPKAIVYHHISQSRLTKDYFRKIAYNMAQSEAIMDLIHRGRMYFLVRGIKRAIYSVIIDIAGFLAFRLFNKMQKSFLHECDFLVTCGYWRSIRFFFSKDRFVKGRI